MRKIIVKVCFIVLALLLKLSSVNSQTTLTIDDVDFDYEAGVITKYNATFTQIIVPSELDGVAVREIGVRAFDNKGITNLDLPGTLLEIRGNAFSNNEIRTIIIPEGVKAIGKSAFSLNLLETISIASSVESIGESAFANSKHKDNIPNVYLTFNSHSKLLDIGDFAFANAFLVTTGDIPLTVKNIGNGVFANNSISNLDLSLTNIVSIGANAFNKNSLRVVKLPNSLREIGSNAFSNNNNVLVNLPEYLEERSQFINWIDSNGNTYDKGARISDYSLSYKAQYYYTLGDVDVEVSEGVITNCSYDFFSKYIKIPSQIGGEQIIRIGHNVFFQKELKAVNLPLSLQSIGSYSFGQTSLTEVSFPEGLLEIEQGAFSNNSLSSISLPSSIKYIGKQAFIGNSFDRFNLPKSNDELFVGWHIYDYSKQDEIIDGGAVDVGSHSSGILPSYTKLEYYILSDTDVEMSQGVIQFCSYSFDNKCILIPEELKGQKVVGIASKNSEYNGVFGSKGLMRVKLPNTLEHIGVFAFSGNRISQVDLPESLTVIDRWAFNNCHLEKLTLPTSLNSIAFKAFFENDIREIAFNTSINTIGESAFENNSLSTIELPNSITFIGEKAFYSNNISEFRLPYPSKEGYQFKEWQDYNNNSFEAEARVSDLYSSYTAILEGSIIELTTWENSIGNVVIKDEIQFSDNFVDSRGYIDFSIWNRGNKSMTITEIRIPDGFEIGSEAWPIEINPNTGHSVTLYFAPTKIGNYNGGVEVVGNFTGGVNTFNVNGNCINRSYLITTISGEGGNITPQNPTLVEGSEQEFVFTPNEGFSIDEIFVDGVLLENNVHTYNLVVTENHSIEVVFKLATSINKNSQIDKLNLYPNPTLGRFKINIGDVTKDAKIEIYSLSGRLLFSDYFQSSEYNFKEDLKKGVYIVMVKTSNKSYSQKLIVR
ncbi:MAG: leucine-rich repeat domain-containing protein [Carboxylicivirga sp.]|jgi:hypothetical protein|nr:leucine-rich repeat domain-containing protein [Carboxylicivirga sp.]